MTIAAEHALADVVCKSSHQQLSYGTHVGGSISNHANVIQVLLEEEEKGMLKLILITVLVVQLFWEHSWIVQLMPFDC